MLYAAVRFISRVALHWFYRSIEVIGAHHVPPRGAVLLAANHPNAMVDALLVMAALPRPVRLTAKATLLRNPVTRLVVRLMGIVPLRRASDEQGGGNLDRNQRAFSEVVQTLAAGRVVLIFPEGRSHSEPSLAALRTGCARIALEARTAGTESLLIVPVGLVFERKDLPRTRVAVQFGPAIPVLDASGPERTRVEALMAEVEAGMRDVTLNFQSIDEAEQSLQISRALAAVLDELRPLERPGPSLADTIQLARRVHDARVLLPRLTDTEAVAAAQRLVEQLRDLRVRLNSLRIPLSELWLTPSLWGGVWFIVRETGLAAIAGPIAIIGRLTHFVPLRLATWAGRVTARSPEDPAMHTLIGGIAVVVLYYVGLAVVVGRSFGPAATILTIAGLPLAAWVDFKWTERLTRLLRRARVFLLFRSEPTLQRTLVSDAAAIRAGAERLDAILELARRSPDVEAGTDQPGPSARHPAGSPSGGPSVA